MRVLPYNRCVSTLGEKSPEEFLRLVSSVFRIIDRNSGNYINADSCSDESIQSDEIESVGVAVDLSTRPLTNPPVCSLLSVRSLSTSSLGVQHFSSSRVSSPEKSIVRGLVVSMDSESESDSESDSNSEIEDQEGLDNISTFYNSSGFSYSILERSLPNRDSEKSQRSVAVSLLEQDLEGANCSDMYIRARDVEVLEHSGKESCLCAPGERPIVDRLIGHHLPHIISMYFEGRWLDLSPIEAVEDNAMDPLASLNIQVGIFFYPTDLCLFTVCVHYKILI